MKKRLLAVLVATMMFLVCIPAMAFASGWNEDHTKYFDSYGNVVTDELMYISQDDAWFYFTPSGEIGKGWNKFNWGSGDYYCYGDPTTGHLVSGWQKIGGYWYYFALPGSGDSQDGKKFYYSCTMYDHGAAKVNGKWYYFGTQDSGSKTWGKMQYKWAKAFDDDIGAVWYYADPNKDGQLASGWKKIDGKWYFFENNEEGTWSISKYCKYNYGMMYFDGVERVKGADCYYFAGGGAMKTGWIKESYTAFLESGDSRDFTEWYYADPNNGSKLASGWKKMNGSWYYFDPDVCQVMVANDTCLIKGKRYIFTKSGKLNTTAGWVNLYAEYKDGSDKPFKVSHWVYSDKNGIATTGWKKISGNWYHFDNWGFMTANGWAQDSKGWCWMGSNGKMVKSQWIEVDEEWYYILDTGYRATGKVVIGGIEYEFDEVSGWLINRM